MNEYKVKNITLKSKYVPQDDYYEITAYSNANKKMGFLTYKINRSNVWLNFVGTSKKYQHQGVGTALIKTFEYEIYKKGQRFIEGKYYPKNEFAKPLYDKNGYDIYRDDYEMYVGKSMYLTKEQEKELFDTVKPVEKEQEM